MMKLAVTALLLFLVLNPSQAKTNTVETALEFQKHSASKTQTPTKSVRALVAKKTQRLLLITNDLSDGDNGPPGADELDMQSPYQRPRISKPLAVEDDISDYAVVRLAVARARAMEIYRQKYA